MNPNNAPTHGADPDASEMALPAGGLASAPLAPVGAVRTSSPPASRGGKKSISIGTEGRVVELSVPMQNLLNDEFIANAPRVDVAGRKVPALGGIPLLSKLGQGGMGAVYYGIHPGLALEVAVKVLPFHLAQMKPQMIKRFFREARIAAKISSEHLVRVTDVDQEASLSFLVMEYVSGKSAAGILKDALFSGSSGLDEIAALEICIGACKGLAAAHAANVVHRDLKPDNILIPHAKDGKSSDYSRAKLADLGLARFDEENHSMTGAESCLGTPGYMAPEQIVDARKGGKPADVFGLGATLYALLCGEAPFVGETSMQVMWATIDNAHTPIRTRRGGVSKPVAELIDICLAKDPAHRYSDGAALLKALEACRKALVDPQAVNYAEVNQPRIEREKIQLQLDVAAAAARPVPAPEPIRSRTPFWIAGAAALCLGGAAIALWTPFDSLYKPAQKETLPSAKKLDDSERAADASFADDEAKRKKAYEAYSKKLKATADAGQAESAKPRDAK